MKQIFYMIAFIAFAFIGAMDWKTDGWFGHTWTGVMALSAVLAMAVAMHDLANG